MQRFLVNLCVFSCLFITELSPRTASADSSSSVHLQYPCHTYTVQAAVLYGSTNILGDRRLRLSCGRSREVYVLIVVNTLPGRSSR